MLVDITGPARRKVWGISQRERYMAAINVKFKRLSRHPKLGIVRNDLRGAPRALLAGEHIILYEIAEDALVVMRVLHQARDSL